MARIFDVGGLGGLVRLILSAAGLGLPIGAMIGLASFGSSFVQRLGGSPLMGAIILTIRLLLVGSLVNTVTPFVDAAFDSLEGDRFTMCGEGIGSLSLVVGNVYGVILVGGLVYVAWQVIGQFRGGGSMGTGNIFLSGGPADRM